MYPKRQPINARVLIKPGSLGQNVFPINENMGQNRIEFPQRGEQECLN